MLKSFRQGTWDKTIFELCSTGREYGKIDVANKIVFDIGAHIGGFTDYALRNGAKRVFAFEANKENYEHFMKNVGYDKRVVSYNKALWWNSTDVFLFNKSKNPKNTGGGGPNKNKGETVVHTIDLSSVISKHNIEVIDVMKIDCEGSEYPIFYNLPFTDLSKIQYITGEYHNIFNLDSEAGNIFALYDFSKYRPVFEDLKKYMIENGFVVLKEKSATKELGHFQLKRKVSTWST